MPRRTRVLKLALLGPSLLAAGCGRGDAPAPRTVATPAPMVAELGPQEERVLAAALGANAVGNGPLGPLPALPVAFYAFATSEPPRQPGQTRRYPSSTYRRSATYVAPFFWTTSRYHSPSVYRPGTPPSRPAAVRTGGFGNAGHSVSG